MWWAKRYSVVLAAAYCTCELLDFPQTHTATTVAAQPHLAEGVLPHLRVELVAPPAAANHVQSITAVPLPTSPYYSGTQAVCCGRWFASAPTHRRRQLFPERPLMPAAMMLQFLAP